MEEKVQAPVTTEETTAPAPLGLVPQPHGGALNTGGTPGNKGGRPPNEFKALMAQLASGKPTVNAVKKILNNPDHPQFVAAWKWATERGYGKSPDILTGPDGPVQLEIIVTRRLIDDGET